MTIAPTYWGTDGGGAPLVCAVGAINGLAFNAHQTWAFWRASMDSLKESPFRCANGEKATMCQQATLPPRAFGAERMVPMLEQALDQLAPAVARLPQGGRTMTLLCLGERYGTPTAPTRRRPEPPSAEVTAKRRKERDQLTAAAMGWLRRNGTSTDVRVVAQGHASCAIALQAAGAAVMARDVDAAIVGGVDTYYDPTVIDELLRDERLFDGEDIHRVIAGEGAAFALVTRRDVARGGSLPELAEVQAVVTNEEPCSMFSNVPNLALGMSRSLRAACDPLKHTNRKLDWMLGDVTHENYRMQEFMFAFPRLCAPGGLDSGGRDTYAFLQPLFDFDFIPERFGDLGAATMPTGLVLAAEAFSRGDPPARTCLLFGASVTAERGALLLTRP